MYLSESIYSISLPYEPLRHWLGSNNYPLSLNKINIDSVINHMKKDKKVISDKIQMILLKGIAQPTITTISDEDLHLHLNTFLGELVKI